MKQTAVEWLFEKLDIVDSSIMSEYLNQAKEMEKQQIIDAYHKGCADQLRVYPDAEYNSEQYYNETFKK